MSSGSGGAGGAVRRRPPPAPPALSHILAAELSELALDQGYHTLAETGGVRRRREPAPPPPPPPPQRALSDALWTKILQQLEVAELCRAARVCRRWARLVARLAARPDTWSAVRLDGGALDVAIRAIASRAGAAGVAAARDWRAKGCSLSPASTHLLTRTFRSLTHVQLACSSVLDARDVTHLLLDLPGLRHLDLTGCPRVDWPEWGALEAGLGARRSGVEYLDLTDCAALTDRGVLAALHTCPGLLYLYLRRCSLVTDSSIKQVAAYCSALKELSVSDCGGVTDFGLYQLARLGPALRYLSVAKCTQVSDAGVGAVARRCYKLRYVNARGCGAVGDDGVAALARGCSRLRALDLGATDVSEPGLQVLARCCPNLKKLALRGCELLGDEGLQAIAYYCRGLRQLNIQDTPVTIRGYRAVKKYCKRCVIEHTNPGFC